MPVLRVRPQTLPKHAGIRSYPLSPGRVKELVGSDFGFFDGSPIMRFVFFQWAKSVGEGSVEYLGLALDVWHWIVRLDPIASLDLN